MDNVRTFSANRAIAALLAVVLMYKRSLFPEGGLRSEHGKISNTRPCNVRHSFA